MYLGTKVAEIIFIFNIGDQDEYEVVRQHVRLKSAGTDVKVFADM